MPNLITLAEFKAMQRVGFADDDALANLLIEGASDSILAYMKTNGYADFYDGTNLTATVPSNVKVATAYLSGVLYENYNGDPDKAFMGDGYLPAPVVASLYQRHDPAIA